MFLSIFIHDLLFSKVERGPDATVHQPPPNYGSTTGIGQDPNNPTQGNTYKKWKKWKIFDVLLRNNILQHFCLFKM